MNAPCKLHSPTWLLVLLGSCRGLTGLSSQRSLDWVFYEPWTFIAHSSGLGKPKMKVSADLVSGEGMLSPKWYLLCVLTWKTGQAALWSQVHKGSNSIPEGRVLMTS